MLLSAERVLSLFRTSFLGKVSPVHLFWGAFDLAVTRFSGRPAPPHPGGFPALPDSVAREAYSHEVSSAGFWPGGAGAEDAAFYSYAYPEPDGFKSRRVQPAAALYDSNLREFVLPYDAVRTADDPDGTLLAFLASTCDAAADCGAWDRAALECELGRPGILRRTRCPTSCPTPRSLAFAHPLDFVVGDFHAGPYVRDAAGDIRRTELGAFIDHCSRFVPESRCGLTEDLMHVRRGLRALVIAHGRPHKLYVDRGPGYQAHRFHFGCAQLDIELVHSKPYVSEGRGVIERFHRTVKEAFEIEVRLRKEPPTLDELNQLWWAWLDERYHRTPQALPALERRLAGLPMRRSRSPIPRCTPPPPRSAPASTPRSTSTRFARTSSHFARKESHESRRRSFQAASPAVPAGRRQIRLARPHEPQGCRQAPALRARARHRRPLDSPEDIR